MRMLADIVIAFIAYTFGRWVKQADWSMAHFNDRNEIERLREKMAELRGDRRDAGDNQKLNAEKEERSSNELHVVLEGLDAAGKATNAKRLIEKLDSLGRAAVLFSFPRYETETGKAIKRLLTGEIVLHTQEDAAGETYSVPDEDAAHPPVSHAREQA